MQSTSAAVRAGSAATISPVGIGTVRTADPPADGHGEGRLVGACGPNTLSHTKNRPYPTSAQKAITATMSKETERYGCALKFTAVTLAPVPETVRQFRQCGAVPGRRHS